MHFKRFVSAIFYFFYLYFAKFGILKVFGGNFEIFVFWTLARDKKFVKNVKGN